MTPFSTSYILNPSMPPDAVIIAFMFILGSVIGSFLNVVIYRLPRKMNIAWPASHCTACGHPIRWYHNVPIFGWLWLRGRCWDCGVKISPRYPLIEFAVGLAFAAIGWFFIF